MSRAHSRASSRSEKSHDERAMEEGSVLHAESVHEEVPHRSTFKSVVLVMTCTFAMIVNSANNTAVAISLSTIGRDFHINETGLQWLVSAYPLSSGCLLIVCGRIADLYGRKKTFLVGSVLLAAFTLGCGFAQDAVTLEILRGFQGIGAAATIPASLGILAHGFPPGRARSAAFATFAAGAPVGAAFGMALGGALTQVTEQTWRSPFYFETGFTVLCLFGGVISFDKDLPSEEEDKRIDWLGAFLVTAGLVLIVFVLGQGEIAPQKWKTPYIIALLILGVILLIAFLVWQRYLERIADLAATPHPTARSSTATIPAPTDTATKAQGKVVAPEEKSLPTAAVPPEAFTARAAAVEREKYKSWKTPPPLMKLSLWRRGNGRLAVAMWIAFLTWCAFLAWTFWAQLYYQNFLGLTPLLTVVRLLPMFISGIICNVIVAAVIGHVPILAIIATGTMGTSLACLLFALIDPSKPYWAYGFPAAIIVVAGADFVFAAGTLYVAHVSLPHEQSLAGALFQTMTQLGTSLGITVTTVIFNQVTTQKPPFGPPPPPNGGHHGPGPWGGEGPRPHNPPGHIGPGLLSYQAAEWGCFAFGILATLLALIFFRGVGVIGKKDPKSMKSPDQHPERD